MKKVLAVVAIVAVLGAYLYGVGTLFAASFGFVPTELALAKAGWPLFASLAVTFFSLAWLPHHR